MNENVCTHAGTRNEVLVAYLYDEIASDERSAFDRHLMTCALCRSELDALGGVRAELDRWTPPEPSFSVVVERSVDIPAWAQVAAALLFLGVSAGLANLDVALTAGGISIRTGWRHPQTGADGALSAGPAPVQAPALAGSPWEADLTALEQKLRRALDARPATVATAAAPASSDVVLRRVQALLQESEQRQRSELALRVAEIARDVQTQRQADLVRIDRSLGLIQSRTGIEVMRTQQQVNSLAQRVSQRQ
jgi:hypothetical protein